MEDHCWDLKFVYIGGGAGPDKRALARAELRRLLTAGWEPFASEDGSISLRKLVPAHEVSFGAAEGEAVDHERAIEALKAEYIEEENALFGEDRGFSAKRVAEAIGRAVAIMSGRHDA